MTEKELIRRSKDGDIESFEKLILSHQNRVYNIALKTLKNEHDAFDASQEVFLKAFKYINKFKEKSTFSTWLYRITVNVCLDMIKKNKDSYNNISSDKETDENEVLIQIEDKKTNIENEILKKERQRLINEAISLLNDEHRQMIVLRDIEGFSYDEIAKITNKNIGTVKSKINRARLALKEILKNNRELFFMLIVLLISAFKG